MKKSRVTHEQIIGFLNQAETGAAVKELGRQLRRHLALDAKVTFRVMRRKWSDLLPQPAPHGYARSHRARAPSAPSVRWSGWHRPAAPS